MELVIGIHPGQNEYDTYNYAIPFKFTDSYQQTVTTSMNSAKLSNFSICFVYSRLCGKEDKHAGNCSRSCGVVRCHFSVSRIDSILFEGKKFEREKEPTLP